MGRQCPENGASYRLQPTEFLTLHDTPRQPYAPNFRSPRAALDGMFFLDQLDYGETAAELLVPRSGKRYSADLLRVRKNTGDRHQQAPKRTTPPKTTRAPFPKRADVETTSSIEHSILPRFCFDDPPRREQQAGSTRNCCSTRRMKSKF